MFCLAITSTGQSSNIPSVEPIRQTNPWETPPAFRHNSPAESWLMSAAATSISNAPGNKPVAASDGSPATSSTALHVNAQQPTAQKNVAPLISSSSHLRSQSVDTAADLDWYNQQRAPTLRELQQRNQLIANFKSEQHTAASAVLPPQPQVPASSLHNQPLQQVTNTSTVTNTQVQQRQVPPVPGGGDPWSAAPLGPTSSDPFDAAWATKSPNVKQQQPQASLNPFHAAGGGDAVTQTFKVQL